MPVLGGVMADGSLLCFGVPVPYPEPFANARGCCVSEALSGRSRACDVADLVDIGVDSELCPNPGIAPENI